MNSLGKLTLAASAALLTGHGFAQSPQPTLQLKSSAIGKDGVLPVEYTGDGKASTPPLEWTGAPAGTKSFAVVMHHIDPQKVVKWYWVVFNIPASVHELPKNMKGIGQLGTNSINNRNGYAPPHSKGPGPKTYILTVYALDSMVNLDPTVDRVSRAKLLETIQGHILGTAELKTTYTRY